ncbi:MAG TPA: aldo/keto reductase [Anaerolineae bacterium]|nr:aldo/keto reductase [Anaerolineae bacterium]HIQ11641.1 aldo/keto reductase [Caldilineales bacterium]
MEYRNMGRTGLKLSEISLGGWLTFGGQLDDETSFAIIDAAVEHGVNFIDLADIYARGNAERVFGRWLKGKKRRDFVISSKVYWPMSDNVNDRGLSRKHIMESIEGSLRRLGTDYLDIYFCHRHDPETPLEEVVRAMTDLVQQGKVLYWGTSVWEADQIEGAVDIAREWLGYQPFVEQPRYNMLDRHIEDAIMPMCAEKGLGIVAWSPLAQGVLTTKYLDGIPEGSRATYSQWIKEDLTEANLAKVRKLHAIAGDLGLTMPQLALAWILRRPEISSIITGASQPEQVEENVKASGVELSEDVLAEIERILV